MSHSFIRTASYTACGLALALASVVATAQSTSPGGTGQGC